MKLAVSIVLFIIFNITQCLRRRPRPQNVANPSPMLTFTGTVMCKGVPDSSAKVSFGRRVILSSMFANQFPNRRGQFSFNIRKNQCRIGSCFLQIDHQCKIYKQGCFIRLFIPLNVAAFLKKTKNSRNPYNLQQIDLVKHFKGQQFLCSRRTDRVFSRNLK